MGGRLVKCDFRSHSGSHQSSAVGADCDKNEENLYDDCNIKNEDDHK